MTQYDVLVTDVIKQGERSERAGVTVEVVVHGLGGNDTELGLEERFTSGDELILGLVWWPSRGVYALSLGADSAFSPQGGESAPKGPLSVLRWTEGAHCRRVHSQPSSGVLR